jgi:hypothetical protein
MVSIARNSKERNQKERNPSPLAAPARTPVARLHTRRPHFRVKPEEKLERKAGKEPEGRRN